MTSKPKHPEMTPIHSSAISGYHYDQPTHALHIKFNSGKVYLVKDVSHERAMTFAESLSKGKYFNSQLKPFHIVEEVT